MNHKFSQKLIEDCQKYFSKKKGILISEDKAEIYLSEFARLGNLAIKVIENLNINNQQDERHEKNH